jgi:hypothetical protein
LLLKPPLGGVPPARGFEPLVVAQQSKTVCKSATTANLREARANSAITVRRKAAFTGPEAPAPGPFFFPATAATATTREDSATNDRNRRHNRRKPLCGSLRLCASALNLLPLCFSVSLFLCSSVIRFSVFPLCVSVSLSLCVKLFCLRSPSNQKGTQPPPRPLPSLSPQSSTLGPALYTVNCPSL